MTQEEVYEWLKNNPGWHTTRHISEKTKMSRTSVQNAVKRLLKSRHLEAKEDINPYRDPRKGGPKNIPWVKIKKDEEEKTW